jgi:hypothetical protein
LGLVARCDVFQAFFAGAQAILVPIFLIGQHTLCVMNGQLRPCLLLCHIRRQKRSQTLLDQ